MQEYVDRFKDVKILVVGDMMLDRYWRGSASRLSPEAPVPVVNLTAKDSFPGGAANVACNVASLGGKCYLVGAVGRDPNGYELLEDLQKKGVTEQEYVVFQGITTVKIRIIAQGQQVTRVDEDNISPKQISRLPESIDLVIISDYAKGVITQDLCERLSHYKVPILVDPKPVNMGLYRGQTLLKFNRDEAEAVSGIKCHTENGLIGAGEKLRDRYNADIVITAAADGAYLFKLDGSAPKQVPSEVLELTDVSGAGDSFIAALGLSLASKLDLERAVILANKVAGIKCGKHGTATVSAEELKRALGKN